MMRAITVVAFGTLLAACATAPDDEVGDLLDLMGGADPAEAAQIAQRVSVHPLGSEENPVRADMPRGQRAYLDRLRCADGAAPSYSRVGSMGSGPYGSIIDGYEVICTGGEPADTIIMIDMYHPGHVEKAAPKGFTIVP